MAKKEPTKPTTIRRGTPLAIVPDAPAGLTLREQAAWAKARRDQQLAKARPPSNASRQ